MIHYRSFRNADPPSLMLVWNSSAAEAAPRSMVPLRMAMLLEYFTLSKPYFDPRGLVVAESEGRVVGFSHAGFSQGADFQLNHQVGVVCTVCVLPDYRRRGIGSELLRRCEAYLAEKGVQELRAGPHPPANPFTLGLYGGSNSPGFLESQPQARSFFERHGYQLHSSRRIYQLKLEGFTVPVDLRFPDCRQRFEIYLAPHHARSWWKECVLGPIEPLEFSLKERKTGEVLAKLILWEMEPYNAATSEQGVGILDLHVVPQARRQGFARFLLSQSLRYLQEQFIHKVEFQLAEENTPAQALIENIGFVHIDTGHVYHRTT